MANIIGLLDRLEELQAGIQKLGKGIQKISKPTIKPFSKNNASKISEDSLYDKYLNQLADKQSQLDQINHNISQKSKQAAQRYVQTGHAKPLTKVQQNMVSHRAGSDFVGQYIIEPSGMQKAFGKVQINKIKNLDGKVSGADSLVPVNVKDIITLYSPKNFITINSNTPSILGYYPEKDLDAPRNIAGLYFPKYNMSTIDPSQAPISPLYTVIHERSSHGTDDLMKKLKVTFRWKGSINQNPVHTVQEHYQKLVDDIVDNNPNLNIDGSKLWYELRATDNEITARAYQKVFIDAKKAGKIPQDASINDEGVIESLRPAYEQEIDKLTPESLAKIYASVNGYGKDYAKAIQNAIEKAQSINNTKELNTFVDNLKSGIKYLPATIPIGIGIANTQNQYKQGSKNNILIGKSGIHIKKKNKGKFTAYCGGTVTQACINRAKASGNTTLVKRATFAENSRKWKHKNGGILQKLQNGGYVSNSSQPQVLQRYIGLLNNGIKPQAAFDTSHLSIIEDNRPGKYYSFGKRANTLNGWIKNATNSLTIGRYSNLRNVQNLQQFKQGLRNRKYNSHSQFYQKMDQGRNRDKQIINNWNRQNGVPLISMLSNNYGQTETV